MGKLTYLVAITVDGFIARENGGADCFPMAGDLLQYLAQEYPETLPTHVRPHFNATGPNRHFDTVVMGRRTYDPAFSLGITSPYAHLRQYVLSKSLRVSPDPAVEVIANDPLGLIRRLKQEDGLGIWLCGGGELAALVHQEIDELILKVNPVVLGKGIPLFGTLERLRSLELLTHRTFSSGVAVHHYKMLE